MLVGEGAKVSPQAAQKFAIPGNGSSQCGQHITLTAFPWRIEISAYTSIISVRGRMLTVTCTISLEFWKIVIFQNSNLILSPFIDKFGMRDYN
ncbi:MAG: hypothetical protein NVSMB33_12190 [Ktedonobacteraceae bacterium]